MAEIQIGNLAKERASAAAVKQFGERLVRDHTSSSLELRMLAQKKGITLPTKLDQKHQELFDQLSKMKGAEFDRTYAKDMAKGHEKAIEKFETESKTGTDAEIKAWATKQLPTLREHLKMARDTEKAVGGNPR